MPAIIPTLPHWKYDLLFSHALIIVKLENGEIGKIAPSLVMMALHLEQDHVTEKFCKVLHWMAYHAQISTSLRQNFVMKDTVPSMGSGEFGTDGVIALKHVKVAINTETVNAYLRGMVEIGVSAIGKKKRSVMKVLDAAVSTHHGNHGQNAIKAVGQVLKPGGEPKVDRV